MFFKTWADVFAADKTFQVSDFSMFKNLVLYFSRYTLLKLYSILSPFNFLKTFWWFQKFILLNKS